MMERYVHTVWCDDIRQEVGNKPSLMGVYTGMLTLPSLPCVLPKLSAMTWMSTPIERRFSAIALRFLRDDGTVLAEVPEISGENLRNELEAPADATRQLLAFGITLSPVEIPDGCKYLKVEVKADSEVLEGSKLRIITFSDLPATLQASLASNMGPLFGSAVGPPLGSTVTPSPRD